ncbi:hypothetical protein SMC26_44805 [Actinomadura fulvescens]|uniref:hypothetical protein n=1 Tax=Actinomadura fulvescens TaxID=46160 RepID=UPI0031D92D91
MRQEGIQGIPTDYSKLSSAQQAAVQKCGMQLLGQADSGLQKKLDELRACMKKRGIKVPPDGQPFVPDAKDPKSVAALRACAT